MLAVAEFFFSLLAFDPFRFGWKSILYCAGIAVASPFCIEKCLEEWNCRRLVKWLAVVAAMAVVASLILLALVRADLFAHANKDTEAQAVVIEGSQPTTQDGDNFYEEAVPVLRLMTASLALAIALGSGLALHDLKRCASNPELDTETLAQERNRVRQHMAALLAKHKDLSNEGAVFEARVQRDFYLSMFTHAVRKSLGKLLLIGICVLLPATRAVRADQRPLNLVVAIDLSASVASKGPDGKTDFAKNVTAVTELLGTVPAGSRVTVIGITGTSFAEPDILLAARVPADAGYFGERLTAARQQLVEAWRSRAAHLAPQCRQTDILGALFVAGQLFDEGPSAQRKVLVIYSDMRQDTREVPLERVGTLLNPAAQGTARRSLPAGLKDVAVYALGVDAAGRSEAAWEALERFWENYLRAAGANLEKYSVLRQVARVLGGRSGRC